MPMFVFLLLVCLYFSLKTKKIKIIFLASSIFLCFFVSIKFFIKPYYLCCGLSGFEQSHQQFKKIASEENISRPTVANPDLGIMSWYKDINILDLGMIGSPVLSKIKSAPIASDFIFEFLSPDIIQSHDIWSCVHYETIFSDIRFKKMYQPVKEEFIQSKSRCRGKILRNGIWIRKNILKSSTSRERMLLDKLSHELNLNIVQDELEYCKSSKFENCSYISRTAYKFLPEFKDKGMYDQLLLIFSNAQITNDFDLYLLKGSIEKNLDKKALAYIVDRHNGKILNQVPTTGADPSVR